MFSQLKLFSNKYFITLQICEERPNSANFIISIIWHVSQHLTQTNKTAFLKMALTKLGNCCMGQQFSTRLYGQVTLKQLYLFFMQRLTKQRNFSVIFHEIVRTN